jgi:hypothetical protein
VTRAELEGHQPVAEPGYQRHLVLGDQYGATGALTDPAEQRTEGLGLFLGHAA